MLLLLLGKPHGLLGQGFVHALLGVLLFIGVCHTRVAQELSFGNTDPSSFSHL